MKRKILHTLFFSCLIAAASFAQQAVRLPNFGDLGTFKYELNSDDAYVDFAQIQPDGKLLVSVLGADQFFYVPKESLYRLTINGKLDTTFGGAGAIFLGGLGGFFHLMPDGKIITAGQERSSQDGGNDDIIIQRFLPNGAADLSFGSNGAVRYYNDSARQFVFGSSLGLSAFAVKPDGKILVAGITSIYFITGNYPFMAQLNPNGSIDSSFGRNGTVIRQNNYDQNAYALLPMPGNKFFAADVYYDAAINNNRSCLIAYKADGSIDSTRGVNGVILNNNIVNSNGKIALSIQGYNRILEYAEDGNNSVLYRYKENGKADVSFGTNGKVMIAGLTTYQRRAIGVQINQKIIINSGSTLKRFGINGSLDAGFGNGGTLDESDVIYGVSFAVNKNRLYTAGTNYFNSQFPSLVARAYGFCNNSVNNILPAEESIKAQSTGNIVTIFPNPVTDKVLISGLSNTATSQLQLTNGAGRILKTAVTGNSVYMWNVQNLTPGLYFIKVTNNKQQSYSFKILKQ